MPLREFTDDEGASWRVWDVHPRLGVLPQDGFGLERRTRDVPELILERRRQRPPESGPGGGWLVFDSEEEKRRLSPVPQDWESCPVGQLLEYWDRAEPAPKRVDPGTEGE
jgi:hypothetical protein